MALPLAAAQFDLESALSSSRGGANAASIDRQLDRLAQLQRQLGTANPAAIATLRGEIGAAVAQTQAIVQQARGEATGAAAGDSPDIMALAVRTQSQAASFMRDLHQYDALLQFDSADDRAAYEQREAERRRRYEEELANLSYSRRSVSGPLWAFAAAGCIARTTGIAGVCFTAFGLMGFSG